MLSWPSQLGARSQTNSLGDQAPWPKEPLRPLSSGRAPFPFGFKALRSNHHNFLPRTLDGHSLACPAAIQLNLARCRLRNSLMRSLGI